MWTPNPHKSTQASTSWAMRNLNEWFKWHNQPKSTQASTSWAMRNLNEWFKWHNSQPGVERCPEELLTPDCSGDTLNKWLQVYVRCTLPKLETKQVSHTHRRHYSLLTGILRSMTAQNPRYPNFIEKKSVVFVGFHRCLGNLFRSVKMALALKVDTHGVFLSTFNVYQGPQSPLAQTHVYNYPSLRVPVLSNSGLMNR